MAGATRSPLKRQGELYSSEQAAPTAVSTNLTRGLGITGILAQPTCSRPYGSSSSGAKATSWRGATAGMSGVREVHFLQPYRARVQSEWRHADAPKLPVQPHERRIAPRCLRRAESGKSQNTAVHRIMGAEPVCQNENRSDLALCDPSGIDR